MSDRKVFELRRLAKAAEEEGRMLLLLDTKAGYIEEIDPRKGSIRVFDDSISWPGGFAEMATIGVAKLGTSYADKARAAAIISGFGEASK